LAFGAHVAAAVDQALSDPLLLHGQRVEAMFEALLVSLGDFQLLKSEDAGRIFAAKRFQVPDSRVVLKSGEQWLIEVKNVYEKNPFRQRRRLMTREYRQGLEAYAAATGAELKVAVFWARWLLWTLVSPGRLADVDGNVALAMQSALQASELGRLGDRTIGTRPPLRLWLTMDPARTSAIGADGMVESIIGDAALYCGDTEIVDRVEQQIAWMFMQHGEWPGSEATPIVDGDRLIAIEFRWEPEEQVNEGFEMIGTLSRMFSRHFAEQTVKGREVVQLRAPLRRGWFAPLIAPDHVSQALPLWRFQLRPSYEATAPQTTGAGA
jgi:hypothetical protein